MRASRENRAERLSERADKVRREANSAMDSAHKMASVIPMGQPILIGHYSEKRDRNYRAKIDSKMRKGFELAEYADSLEARAEAAANNMAIYADDIDPIGKLDARIAELENERDAIKARKHETW